MKAITTLVLSLLSLAYLTAQPPAPSTPAPQKPPVFKEKGAVESKPKRAYTVAEWDTRFHDFGEVRRGERVIHDFVVRNDGDLPLLFSDAKASCGCTVPELPKVPVLPGEETVIQVAFDTKNKQGEVHQSVVVYNNTKNRRSILRIRAVVVE